jgi:hypothetical protein
MNGLIDREIAHLMRVMRPSLTGDMAGPILTSAYWRKRLHELLNASALTKAQLCAIDSLLVELDEFDAGGFGIRYPHAVQPADGSRELQDVAQPA